MGTEEIYPFTWRALIKEEFCCKLGFLRKAKICSIPFGVSFRIRFGMYSASVNVNKCLCESVVKCSCKCKQSGNGELVTWWKTSCGLLLIVHSGLADLVRSKQGGKRIPARAGDTQVRAVLGL